MSASEQDERVRLNNRGPEHLPRAAAANASPGRCQQHGDRHSAEHPPRHRKEPAMPAGRPAARPSPGKAKAIVPGRAVAHDVQVLEMGREARAGDQTASQAIPKPTTAANRGTCRWREARVRAGRGSLIAIIVATRAPAATFLPDRAASHVPSSASRKYPSTFDRPRARPNGRVRSSVAAPVSSGLRRAGRTGMRRWPPHSRSTTGRAMRRRGGRVVSRVLRSVAGKGGARSRTAGEGPSGDRREAVDTGSGRRSTARPRHDTCPHR